MKFLLLILILLQSTQIQAKQWKWKYTDTSKNEINEVSEKKQLSLTEEKNKKLNAIDTKQTLQENNEQIIINNQNISKQDFIIEENNNILSLQENIFITLDTDKNDLISEDEYLFSSAGLGYESDKNDHHTKEIAKENLLNNFNELDINKDKHLDRHEFFKNPKKQEQEIANIQQIFNSSDKDKSGNLSSTENNLEQQELNKIEKELNGILNNFILP